MFKKENGITLVALVVTIIVLLILAGVSISMVLGENGIATRAKESATKTDLAGAQEAINLAVSACQTDYFAKFAEDISVGDPNFTIGEVQAHLDGYTICDDSAGTATTDTTVITNESYYYMIGDAASVAKYKVTFKLATDGNIASAVVTESGFGTSDADGTTTGNTAE